jgi:hypothetical protein
VDSDPERQRDLTTFTWPLLSGTSYTDQFAYSGHAITGHTNRWGKTWAATYGTGGVLGTESNPLSHVKTYRCGFA